jgi:hypothetical protein
MNEKETTTNYRDDSPSKSILTKDKPISNKLKVDLINIS